MTKAFFSALALLLVSPAIAAAQMPPAPFDAVQRAAIVEIVRNALKTDPTILRDAIAALQRRRHLTPGTDPAAHRSTDRQPLGRRHHGGVL
jgi:hypothetical protein